MFLLYRNLVRVRVPWIKLCGCGGQICLPETLGEIAYVKAENVETGYLSDLVVTAANDTDGN